MNRTNKLLPPFNERVLLYDHFIGRWVIGFLRADESNTYWVIDPKNYFGVENARFTHWQSLPGNPNGNAP